MAEGGTAVDSGQILDHYNRTMEDTATTPSLLSLGSESVEPVM